jgi:propionyl-CoA carboxylase alpha chain
MADVSVRPITRLLVANRGEIARRIFRTAHSMGLSTVALYARSDADAPFVREADAAIVLDGDTSAQTYLDVNKILNACSVSGADAVHPGYGFLSENAAFARAVIDAGLVWVGPPIAAIETMGDKLRAKRAMVEAGVPTLPAEELDEGSDSQAAAERVGYPLLIKAAAGGGGRGMRVVEEPADLAQAIVGARREAGAAFGNDTVFIERWLASSRHVEVQILGDQHGELVHLFERECSIQRRHQKIIEEAPSPAVDDALRAAMGKAALDAARTIGYASAGTVEFLLDGRDFWFLEVNTRLQVEHPVTEEITGLDLVREQLRIAEGEPLGYGQADLTIQGHAIEARIYAEDPAQDFLPSPGTVAIWEPADGARFDSGVESGSTVSIEFDPMIAKVIAHAPTRREAAGKLARALANTRIQGLTNNRDFLVDTLRSSAFLAGDTTTDFIERIKPARVRERGDDELREACVVAALFAQARRRREAKVLRFVRSGWRNSHMPPERVTYTVGDVQLDLSYRCLRDGSYSVDVNGNGCAAVVHDADQRGIEISIDGRRAAYRVADAGTVCMVHGPRGDTELNEVPRFPILGGADFEGGLFAPMPGKILATHVVAGDRVEAGQLLVVLEAMKMEHRVTAPVTGTLTELNVAQGDQVDNGQMLAVIEEDAES